MSEKERVLFLTTVFPYPLDNGGKIRAYNNLKALSKKYEIDIVCFAEDEIEECHIKQIKEYCTEIRIIKKVFSNSLSRRSAIKNIIKSIVRNSPFIIEKFNDKRCKIYIEELLSKYNYKAVFFEHLSITCYMDIFKRKIKLILSEQNCEFLLMKRRYNETNNYLKKAYIFWEYIKLRKYEVNVCKQFDEVIMLSQEDKNGLIEAGYSRNNINIIPIAVENSNYLKNIDTITKIENILFMGTMTWYPNEQGILWFIDNAWSDLKKKYPYLTLYVVGKSPSNEVIRKASYNGIIVTGYVDDINEYIEKCDICIIPLFIGGGMRVKILESMAKGIPCISTSIGAEGIEIEHKKNILIADNVDEFIKSIGYLNNNKDLYRNISLNGRKLISVKYSTEVIASRLLELISKNK